MHSPCDPFLSEKPTKYKNALINNKSFQAKI